VVMLPRFAVRASTCRRRYRPIWLRNNGLSYLVSVNAARLAVGQYELGKKAMVVRQSVTLMGVAGQPVLSPSGGP
jgi:hypothetical protein